MHRLRLWVSLAGLFLGTQALASPGSLSAEANARLTYSDNLSLAPVGAERGDWQLMLNPALRARWDGRRLRGAADYALHATAHAHDDERDDVWHSLRLGGYAALVPNLVSLDGDYQIRHPIASPFDGASVDPAVGRDDTTEVGTLRVAPRLDARIAQRGRLLAEVEQRYVWYPDAPLRDSVATRWTTLAEAGARPGGLGARASYTRQDVELDGAHAARFEESLATLLYAPTAALTLSAGGGYERNEYTTFRPQGELRGRIWQAGADWRPARTTRLQWTVSERYFGTAHDLSVSHRARATLWSGGYSRAISSSRDTQFLLSDVLPVYHPDCPPEQPGCEPAGFIPIYSPTLVDQYFLQERAHGAVTYERARSRWTLALHATRRAYEETGEVERVDGVSAQWRWRFAARSDLSTTLSAGRAERDTREERLYSLQTGLTRRLSARIDTGLHLRHQRSEARGGGSDRRENAVVLTARGTL